MDLDLLLVVKVDVHVYYRTAACTVVIVVVVDDV